MQEVITLSPASYQFISEEVLMVHALCDRALVPRVTDGEILSMAQRVNVLEICYRRLVRDVGKVDPTAFH